MTKFSFASFLSEERGEELMIWSGKIIVEDVQIPFVSTHPLAYFLDRDKFVEALKKVRKPEEWIIEDRPMTKEDIEHILLTGISNVGYYDGSFVVMLKDGSTIVLTPPKASVQIEPPPPKCWH